jgi:hypothetical protein
MQLIFLQAGSPHTLGMPPPPQVAGAAQSPQSSIPPHPSPTLPQKRDGPALQVSGTQPLSATHRPDELHLWFAPPQAPQSWARPQPSPTLPQYCPVALAS